MNILKNLNVAEQKTALVTPDYEKEVMLSSRNLPKSNVFRAVDLSTYDILHANTLVLSEGAIQKIVETFGN